MGTTILLGIISIGILIFIHELGHFVMARVAGIRVEVFSIGWGKGLVSFRWKETKIQIGWVPFGGYCKMAGDSPNDTRTGGSGEYYSSSPYRRILVATGGPIFNYLLAFILFTSVVVIGYKITTYPNKILIAKKEDINISSYVTPAQKAGLRDGDVIIEIDGKPVKNWDDITENIVRNALKPVKMKVLREGKVVELVAVPEIEKETGRGIIGIYPWVDPVIGKVIPGSTAAKAGLQEGDVIQKVDGKDIRNQMDFYNAIAGKSGKQVRLTVNRGGRDIDIVLVPEKVGGFDSAGITFKQITYKSPRYPLYIAVSKGFEKSVESVQDTIRGMVLLFSGKIKARTAVAGPAKLIYISGVIAKEGIIYFFQVMSYISVAFFIINLVPFPALDGSHIAIALYEIVTRKRPKIEIIYKIQAIGFIFLIVVLIFVTMNDISSFFKR